VTARISLGAIHSARISSAVSRLSISGSAPSKISSRNACVAAGDQSSSGLVTTTSGLFAMAARIDDTR
jgi:hypothetical protein